MLPVKSPKLMSASSGGTQASPDLDPVIVSLRYCLKNAGSVEVQYNDLPSLEPWTPEAELQPPLEEPAGPLPRPPGGYLIDSSWTLRGRLSAWVMIMRIE